jgi:hypothetical protein
MTQKEGRKRTCSYFLIPFDPLYNRDSTQQDGNQRQQTRVYFAIDAISAVRRNKKKSVRNLESAYLAISQSPHPRIFSLPKRHVDTVSRNDRIKGNKQDQAESSVIKYNQAESSGSERANRPMTPLPDL